jgi:predicted NAD-dependent protein-ADP-ribosyltransferase YbiA (DUF1768 family)
MKRKQMESSGAGGVKQVQGNAHFRQNGGIVFKSNMKDVSYLSNFAPALMDHFIINGRRFKTVEHAYQYAKASHVLSKCNMRTPSSPELPLVDQIHEAITPQKAKQLGGKKAMATYIVNHADIKPRLDLLKTEIQRAIESFDHVGVMRDALACKFKLNSIYGQRLLATGDAPLGESRGRQESIWTINKAGEAGLLGTLLMERRRTLREEKDKRLGEIEKTMGNVGGRSAEVQMETLQNLLCKPVVLGASQPVLSPIAQQVLSCFDHVISL